MICRTKSIYGVKFCTEIWTILKKTASLQYEFKEDTGWGFDYSGRRNSVMAYKTYTSPYITISVKIIKWDVIE